MLPQDQEAPVIHAVVTSRISVGRIWWHRRINLEPRGDLGTAKVKKQQAPWGLQVIASGQPPASGTELGQLHEMGSRDLNHCYSYMMWFQGEGKQDLDGVWQAQLALIPHAAICQKRVTSWIIWAPFRLKSSWAEWDVEIHSVCMYVLVLEQLPTAWAKCSQESDWQTLLQPQLSRW